MFQEQETLVGPHGALYENVAHVHNSLGDYDKAEEYFLKAMALVSNPAKKGGILLGMGLVQERLGKPDSALPYLEKALELYKESAGNDDGSSLIAKAHMSVGQCHETLGNKEEGTRHIRCAVRIFKKTVGDSPLTANALGTLGRMLLDQNERQEAEPVILQALEMEVSKDAFHPDTVWKLLNNLKELWTEGATKHHIQQLRTKCSRYLTPIRVARDRIAGQKPAQGESKYDQGTVAVIYKTAGELIMLAGEYKEALDYLRQSVLILQTIKDFDCRSLIASCNSSMHFLIGQLSASAAAGSSASGASIGGGGADSD
mmetsp:Transcript_10063/g.24794  ORF Transcript_10063/g.24794 Transcript_10063/m.24794 type:complete len:315 (+) Transcript_10063:1011-1955(+)